MPRDNLKLLVKQQLTGKALLMRISAVHVVVQNLARSLQFIHFRLPQSTHEPLQLPSSANAGVTHSRLDYKDSSRERKQHRLLGTTGNLFCFTWQCLGTWFYNKAASPNDFHLQLSLFVHHSHLNVTWWDTGKKNRKKEECLCQRTWLQTFSGCFPKSPDTFLSPQIHS